jgi:signal transduction histidine kinase
VRRWLFLVAIAVAEAVVGYLGWRHDHGQLRNVLLSASWIYTGLFVWYRRPENRTGKLMVLTGAAFWSLLAEGTRVPLLWTIGSSLEALSVLPLTYLLLSFPRGYLESRGERVFMGVSVLFLVFGNIQGSFFYDPREFGCVDCQPHLNLLLVHRNAWWVQWTGNVWHSWLTLSLVALTVIVVARFLRGTAPARRVLGPMLLPASALLLALAAQQFVQAAYAFWHVVLFSQRALDSTTDAAFVAGIALPIAFVLGIATAVARRGRVSKLVVELADLPPLDELEQAMSRTLGDPSLEVGRWDAATRRYVGVDGATLDLPDEGSQRTATFLERDGTPLAAIVHDPALLEDHGLLDSVGAAARSVVETDRLQAELRSKLAEVRASRARLVQAGDEARRRLERDLHDGAQQRLMSIYVDMKVAASTADPSVRGPLEAAAAELKEGIAELRELARGIHPSILTEEGLRPAVQSLAERASVPVELHLRIDGDRFDPQVEAAAYFLVSEALTNVAKHAGAARAVVTVARSDGRLVVEVADDGVGGADPADGSGLSGLADRVGAVDGTFDVKSSPGDGTRVVAEIPCG